MRKGAVIALIIILLCVAGGVIGFIAYQNVSNDSTNAVESQSITQKQSSGLDLEIETGQDQKIVYGKSITIPGWTRMEIPAYTTEDVNVDFYNPTDNEGVCYLTFEWKLADTGETLYKSGLVQPGDHLRYIKLLKSLEPGTYKTTLHMQPYSLEDRSELNSADITIELVVK